jgi:phosphoglucosamine mutase
VEKRFRTGHKGSLSQSREAKKGYFEFVLDTISRKGLNRGIRIVVDPGNGAASGFASELFSAAGLGVIPINDEPDGSFPGRNPEPKGDTLDSTVQFLRQQQADLAICFDGDADRVVFCDQEGFLGFSEPLAFMSRLAVQESGRKKVATTVETGKLLDLALQDLGAEVVRGRVGDVDVAYLAREHDAAIGVEPVGVYIMPEVGYYPDSIVASLTLLSRIHEAGEIRRFCENLPRLFTRQEKLACPARFKAAVMKKIEENARSFEAKELNTLDGLRFEFDYAWLLIRASGTEPAVRVIAESGSSAETEKLLSGGVQAVKMSLEEVVL